MRRSKAELHEAIALAFADREYPGDDRIADSDPRYESYERHAIAAFHRGSAGRRSPFVICWTDTPAIRREPERLRKGGRGRNKRGKDRRPPSARALGRRSGRAN
jgi:hypothetical protein